MPMNVLWNCSQKSKLHPQRYEIHIKVRECLLQFTSESWSCWILVNNLMIKIHSTFNFVYFDCNFIYHPMGRSRPSVFEKMF